eukprot:4203629-Alexandrium_andersonii.AAC.1
MLAFILVVWCGEGQPTLARSGSPRAALPKCILGGSRAPLSLAPLPSALCASPAGEALPVGVGSS